MAGAVALAIPPWRDGRVLAIEQVSYGEVAERPTRRMQCLFFFCLGLGAGCGRISFEKSDSEGGLPEFAGDCRDEFEDATQSLCRPPALPSITRPGNGTFTQSSFAGFGAPCDLAFADFDGSGTLDIVASVSEGSTGTVLSGSGDGTFELREERFSWRDLSTVDLGCDGATDLFALSGGCGNGVLLSLHNAGSFAFDREEAQSVCNPAGTELADLDQDGDLEAIVFGFDVHVHDGSNLTRRCALRPGAIYLDSLRVRDFDLDGLPDIVASKGTEGVYFAPGQQGALEWNLSKIAGNASQLEAIDTTGDGNDDVVFADPARDGVFVRDASKDFPLLGHGILSRNEPATFAAADFNADGILDLLTAGATEVRLFWGTGDAKYSDGGVVASTSGVAHRIASADFNADGAADFVVCAGETLSVHIAQVGG